MDCEALKKKVDAEKDPAKKAVLQAEYDAKCGAQPQVSDGGGPDTPPPGGGH